MKKINFLFDKAPETFKLFLMVEPVLRNPIDLINYFSSNSLVVSDENGFAEIRRARTNSAVAEELLAENRFCIIEGQIHYFDIKHLGFKTYLIRPRPANKVNTFICDSFEIHSIPMCEGCIPTAIY